MFPSLEAVAGLLRNFGARRTAACFARGARLCLLRARPANSRCDSRRRLRPEIPISASCCPIRRCIICSCASLNFPVVATSGNLSDEPICIDENEALERLRGIADVFLVHDRPIVRHVDDSIVRVMCRPGNDAAPRPRLRAAARSLCNAPAADGARRRGAFEKHRRAERRIEMFSLASTSAISRPQQAHRRFPPVDRRSAAPLRSETGDHRPRSAPGLSLDEIRRAGSAAPEHRRPASLGAHRFLHGGE